MILIGMVKESSYAKSPSLSIDFKVILTSNVNKRYISDFVNHSPNLTEHRYSDRFISSSEPASRKFGCYYYYNKRQKDIKNVFSDNFTVTLGSISKTKYVSKFKTSFFGKRDTVRKIRSFYDIKVGLSKRSIRFNDAYYLSNYSSKNNRLHYGCRYSHIRTKNKICEFISLFDNYFVGSNAFKFGSDYINNLSFYLMSNGPSGDINRPSVIKNTDSVDVLIPMPEEKIGVAAGSELRVFLTFPPRFVNFCATKNTGPALPYISFDNSLALIIPNVLTGTSTMSDTEIQSELNKLSSFSISIYRYNPVESDSRQVINGIIHVDSNLYDPEPLSNLNAKLIDIRDETLSLAEEETARNSESQRFEIRFSPASLCCLDKEISIDGTIDTMCTIPNSTVQYDIIEEEKDSAFKFDNNLDGFERTISTIERGTNGP